MPFPTHLLCLPGVVWYVCGVRSERSGFCAAVGWNWWGANVYEFGIGKGIRMKRFVKEVIGGVALALMLGGCGMQGSGGQQLQEQGTDRQESEEGAETVSVTDIRTLQELAQRDNSLDAYSAVQHAILPSERPKAELMEELRYVALGENSAACYVVYAPSPEEEREEFAMVTTGGDESLIDLTGDRFYAGMGTALGKDSYFLYGRSGEVYSIFEVDGGINFLREIQLDFVGSGEKEYEYIAQLVADTDGRLHAIIEKTRRSDEGWYVTEEEYRYCVISAEGELLAEYVTADTGAELVPLYDGRVALAMEQKNQRRLLLQCMDIEANQLTTVLDCERELAKFNYYYTLMDENTLVYANAMGIYRTSLSGGEPELLYLWMNHGVTLSSIMVMQAREDRISLIYRCEKGLGYLCIEPTTEEVELKEITIVVPSYKSDIYRLAVVEFNRRYPACHINMKSYDDNTTDALLTELNAGKGPVLIDALVTGFSDKEALWEPVEEVLQQLGVMDNLVDKAMDQGRINGTLYGVVMDFYLETVVTADKELTDWDYDRFLQLVSERKNLKAVMNSCATQDGWYFIVEFFIQSMEDNYFLDAETAATNFDSEEFRTILHLARDYCERKDFVNAVEGLEDGQVFCNVITITQPEQLALYRFAYGDRVNYIGFPSKNGARPVIRGGDPMVMRKNATKEEKELAYAFLEILLSEEILSKATDDLNYKLSVRKDVLAEQLAGVGEWDMPYATGFEPISLEGAVDHGKDAELLYGLLEKAEPRTGFPRELYSLIAEEVQSYLEGTVTEEVVIQNLTNRVGLYLEERK